MQPERSGATASLSLVPIREPRTASDGQKLNALVQRDRLLEQLREDKEHHHHKQIWTKDPHGGPYRKVERRQDQGSEALQRSLVCAGEAPVRPEDLLGYEIVDAGPTTNFVGNHMTRGAVDLVQAELLGMGRVSNRSSAGLLPKRQRAGDLTPTDSSPSQVLGVGASSLILVGASESSANRLASLRLAARQLLRAQDVPGVAASE